MVRQRVRIRFRKQGDLRLIGHRDLMRCMERLFRRAALRLGMSQGFHPKPRMTFFSPLAVGIEGVNEVMEIELSRCCTSDDVLARLTAHAPPGLVPTSADVLPEGSKKARVGGVRYQMPVPAGRIARVAEKIGQLMAASSYPIQRLGKSAPIDLRPLVEELSLHKLSLHEGLLRLRLRIDGQTSVRPREVLAALGLDDLEMQGIYLTRTAVEIQS